MEEKDMDEVPPTDQMVSEEETLEGALPFDEYGKDNEKLRGQIERLAKEYDDREKIIDRIMDYGTGIENEKALRMYSTSALVKWEASLESYRASQTKKM